MPLKEASASTKDRERLVPEPLMRHSRRLSQATTLFWSIAWLPTRPGVSKQRLQQVPSAFGWLRNEAGNRAPHAKSARDCHVNRSGTRRSRSLGLCDAVDAWRTEEMCNVPLLPLTTEAR